MNSVIRHLMLGFRPQENLEYWDNNLNAMAFILFAICLICTIVYYALRYGRETEIIKARLFFGLAVFLSMLSTYLYLHYYIIRQYFDWSDAILLIANSFLYSWLITWLSFMLLHYVFAATGGIKRYFVKRALWADKIFK